MKDFDQLFLQTLARVRELSERCTVRPAPNVLRCVPLVPFAAQPPSAPKFFSRYALMLINDYRS